MRATRRVEGHLGAVEVVPLQGRLQRGGGGVAGDADGAGHLLVAGLVQGLQDAVGRLDRGQVLGAGERVDVQDVEAVGPQPLEAQLDLTPGVVGLARRELRGQGDLLAPLGHQPADPLLALAVAVGVGGVDVGDPQVEGAGEGLQGLVLVLVHEEPAAGAEAEDRDLHARLAEGAGRELGCGPGAEGRGDDGADGGRLEELTPGELHGWLLTVRGWYR